MAIRYEATERTLTISQTRRTLRLAMWMMAVAAVAVFAMPSSEEVFEVTTTCDRAAGRCTVTRGGYGPEEVPLRGLTGASFDDGLLALRPATGAPVQVCFGSRASLQAATAQLAAFWTTDAPSVTARCETHLASGMPLVGKLASSGGSLLILLLMGRFLAEAETVIDRAAGTITLRGRRWPWTRWDVAGRLDEVAGVRVERSYVGRGQYDRRLYVDFKDGRACLAYAPAAYLVETFDERVAEVRRYCGLPEAAGEAAARG